VKTTVRYTGSRHSGWSARLPTDREIINIMRPGPWGNPFRVGVHGGRGECCDKFESWLKSQYELLCERWRLRGKALRCCCHERERCHGDTWCRVADMTADDLFDWMLDP
jgi:hypothetical protein